MKSTRKKNATSRDPEEGPVLHVTPALPGGTAWSTGSIPRRGRLRVVATPRAASPPASVPPDYAEAPSVQLVARLRDGDEMARAVLCERYAPTFHVWATTRIPSAGLQISDVAGIVHRTLLHVAQNGVASLERESSLLFALRQAIRREGSSIAPVDEPRALVAYEWGLARLAPLEGEAIVCRLELASDDEQLATTLGVDSAECARRIVQQAFLRLAEYMGYEQGRSRP